MKKNKIQKLQAILATACICGILLYGIVSENAKDTKNVQTHKTFTTNDLISQLRYKQDDLKKSIEKAIEIKGEIKKITYRNNRYSLFLKGNKNKTYVLCEMQRDQNDRILKLETGKKIKLKGILKGFLTDVILLNCVIIDE